MLDAQHIAFVLTLLSLIRSDSTSARIVLVSSSPSFLALSIIWSILPTTQPVQTKHPPHSLYRPNTHHTACTDQTPTTQPVQTKHPPHSLYRPNTHHTACTDQTPTLEGCLWFLLFEQGRPQTSQSCLSTYNDTHTHSVSFQSCTILTFIASPFYSLPPVLKPFPLFAQFDFPVNPSAPKC